MLRLQDFLKDGKAGSSTRDEATAASKDSVKTTRELDNFMRSVTDKKTVEKAKTGCEGRR
jgi:hypothetical protein